MISPWPRMISPALGAGHMTEVAVERLRGGEQEDLPIDRKAERGSDLSKPRQIILLKSSRAVRRDRNSGTTHESRRRELDQEQGVFRAAFRTEVRQCRVCLASLAIFDQPAPEWDTLRLQREDRAMPKPLIGLVSVNCDTDAPERQSVLRQGLANAIE
jgi:hypothetical protein